MKNVGGLKSLLEDRPTAALVISFWQHGNLVSNWSLYIPGNGLRWKIFQGLPLCVSLCLTLTSILTLVLDEFDVIWKRT